MVSQYFCRHFNIVLKVELLNVVFLKNFKFYRNINNSFKIKKNEFNFTVRACKNIHMK